MDDLLKIMIVGSPKTGNMWLKHLLAEVYDLAPVDLSRVSGMTTHLDMPRFVTHQHFYPRISVLRWADQNEVRFITMARHPGDLFLSLYHYVNNYGEKWRREGRLGHTPSHAMLGQPLASTAVFDYIRDHFHHECLGKTAAWLKDGRAFLVRYEDLHANPLETLVSVTARLRFASEQRIKSALEKYHFSNMKRLAGRDMQQHFRQGKVGSWSRELEPRHIELLSQSLGEDRDLFDYSFDPDHTEVRSPVPVEGVIDHHAFGGGFVGRLLERLGILGRNTDRPGSSSPGQKP